MGREVKRVPLDFNWPIGFGWPGYHGESFSRTYTALSTRQRDRVVELHELYCKITNQPTDEYGDPIYTYVDPPNGEGYQMWENTSEGSPISPVFDTPEKLARWLSDNGASSFGRDTATYEQWLAMIQGPAWAPAVVMSSDGKIESGVAFMGKKTDSD